MDLPSCGMQSQQMKVSFDIPHPKKRHDPGDDCYWLGAVDPRHIKLHNMFELLSLWIQYFLWFISNFANSFLLLSPASKIASHHSPDSSTTPFLQEKASVTMTFKQFPKRFLTETAPAVLCLSATYHGKHNAQLYKAKVQNRWWWEMVPLEYHPNEYPTSA